MPCLPCRARPSLATTTLDGLNPACLAILRPVAPSPTQSGQSHPDRACLAETLLRAAEQLPVAADTVTSPASPASPTTAKPSMLVTPDSALPALTRSAVHSNAHLRRNVRAFLILACHSAPQLARSCSSATRLTMPDTPSRRKAHRDYRSRAIVRLSLPRLPCRSVPRQLALALAGPAMTSQPRLAV